MSKTPQTAAPPASGKASPLTEGQRAYEAKRAAKAGLSLDKWLAEKERLRRADEDAAAKLAQAAAKEAAPKGWFGRLMDRAHKPIK